MISFLTDNIATIIISLILLCVVGLIIKSIIRQKKAGRGCISCNCKDCSHICSQQAADKGLGGS